MNEDELIKLRKEIDKLEDDLYYKKTFLFENCPHSKMKRTGGKHDLWGYDNEDYIYECLVCKQKWTSGDVIKSFEERLVSTK